MCTPGSSLPPVLVCYLLFHTRYSSSPMPVLHTTAMTLISPVPSFWFPLCNLLLCLTPHVYPSTPHHKTSSFIRCSFLLYFAGLFTYVGDTAIRATIILPDARTRTARHCCLYTRTFVFLCLPLTPATTFLLPLPLCGLLLWLGFALHVFGYLQRAARYCFVLTADRFIL